MGLQVAQSICVELTKFSQHRFVVVLSTYINDEGVIYGDNTEMYRYNIPHSFKIMLTGRDAFLDGQVAEKKVDAVLTQVMICSTLAVCVQSSLWEESQDIRR